MMQEARLILPSMTRDQIPIHEGQRERFLSWIVASFGGATCYDARGAWKDPRDGRVKQEHVTLIDVPVDSTSNTAMDTLFDIARTICKDLKQGCVYLRKPDGAIEFVEV